MRKPSRFLRLLGVAGLLVTLLAATIVPVAAQPDPDPGDGDGAAQIEAELTLDTNTIYFPWVADDDDFGLGPADTSITVQNLEGIDTYIYIFKGTGDGWEQYTTAYLSAWASKTFHAHDLGIEAGTGVPVAVTAYHGALCVTALGPEGLLSVGRDINGNERCTDYEVLATLFDETVDEIDVCVAKASNGANAPYWDSSVGAYLSWENVEDLEIEWLAGGEFGGLNNDGDCVDAEGGATIDPTIIGGVAKTAVDGETLPYTTVSDTSVSGYNALNGWELGYFDQWYLPIVQTNCGPGGCWDTVIRAANYDDENSALTLRFFPSDDGSGSLQTGFQLNFLINGGATESIVLSDYVPEGWVGSVHAYSDDATMLMADRFKVGYNMWLTNTGSSADFELGAQIPGGLGNYVLFAPDVRLDYFGWNTGINIANLYEGDNNVSVQYFNMFGNAVGTRTQRLAAHGMTYFYDPSQLPQDGSSQDPTEDLNADVVGSALIWSDFPVAVAVDATKYPESTTELDANVFQGMTYSATANVYTWQAFPLVQKGNPATGMGATSGINMMNPNSVAAQALVYWVNQSGFGADNFGTTALAIPGFANGFVYTLAQHNLPNGFYGAAVVTANYPIAATSANVDYQVQWDGSVIYNGFNPCGFYRTPGIEGECFFGDPFEQPVGGSVTKHFVDEFGDPVAGAEAILYNTVAYEHEFGDPDYPGIPWTAVGISDLDGEVTWTNVPEGDYVLEANSQTVWLENEQGLPMFEQEIFPAHEFTLFTGEDIVLENELFYLDAIKEVFTSLPGIEVCIFGESEAVVDDTDTWDPLVDIIFECVEADEDGDAFFFELPQGWYWIIVNAGIVFDFDPAFETLVEGPEFFEWGGVYENFPEVDPLGVGSLFKNFDTGLGPSQTIWDNVEFAVDIFCETPVPGCAPGANEVQEFDMTGIGDGGLFALDFTPIGGTTANIVWTAGDDAANTTAIQAAVDAVLGAGNTIVSADGLLITIEFTGVFAEEPIAEFTVSGDVAGTATEVTAGSMGLFANLGPAELDSDDDINFSFLLNSVPVGDYELCYFAELTDDDAGIAGNEIQSFDTGDPEAGTYTITIPALPGGAAGGTSLAIAWDADQAAIQAAVDAIVGVGAGQVFVTSTYNAIVLPALTAGVASITIEYIGPNAGLDVVGVFSVTGDLVYTGPPGAGLSGDAVVDQEGGELADITVFWFGCEEFSIEEDTLTELFNDIDEDGVVVGDIVVEVTGTTLGATYEVCLLYGLIFEVVFDCEDGVAGTGDSVFVTLEPVGLALFNAFLEDELGFQAPSIFRARVMDEATNAVTLSADTPVDPLVDLPPQIIVAAPI